MRPPERAAPLERAGARASQDSVAVATRTSHRGGRRSRPAPPPPPITATSRRQHARSARQQPLGLDRRRPGQEARHLAPGMDARVRAPGHRIPAALVPSDLSPARPPSIALDRPQSGLCGPSRELGSRRTRALALPTWLRRARERPSRSSPSAAAPASGSACSRPAGASYRGAISSNSLWTMNLSWSSVASACRRACRSPRFASVIELLDLRLDHLGLRLARLDPLVLDHLAAEVLHQRLAVPGVAGELVALFLVSH